MHHPTDRITHTTVFVTPVVYYRLAARVLLYAPSHIQDNTYHGLCYTSCGALAETRNSSMDPPHEGSIRRPIAPTLLNYGETLIEISNEFNNDSWFKISIKLLSSVPDLERLDHKLIVSILSNACV